MQADFSTNFHIYPHISTIFYQIVDYQQVILCLLNEKFVDKRDPFFTGNYADNTQWWWRIS